MAAAPSGSSAPAVVDMLRSDGLTAQLLDRTGTPMRFYGIKEEEHLVTAYVEATEGEQFSVKLDCAVQSHNYSARLGLGGQHFKSQSCQPHCWPSIIKSRSISQTEAQTLMFSKAVLTDDETNSIRDPAEVAGLGAISINMHKVKSIRRRIERKFNTEAIGPQQAIYERAKKVGAVQLSAGPVIQKRASPKVKSTYDRTVPVVIFKVHCVTRVGLQLLGYIPKEIENNSPCPAQKRAREEDEILAEETRLEKQLEELKRRRRVLGNAGSPANAGPSTQADESSFTIKAERTVFDFSQGGTADKPFTIDD